jgi:hypothetical protein
MMVGLRNAASSPLRWLVGMALLALSACTAPTPSGSDKPEFMFWPPAPDPPHIQFLTSISSTADVTHVQDALSNFLYGEDNSNDLPFERPYGIREFDGKLFVCDATAATVAILDFRKKEVRLLGQTGQVHLAKPIDVAVAPDGVKYVTDTGQKAVLVYDSTDRYAGRIALENSQPIAVAVRDNELYVTDLNSSKIRVFNRFNGTELRSVGGKGGGKGEFGGLFGMALDNKGNIYANDIITCRLQKLAADGKFVWGLGSGAPGDHPGELNRPKLMAVDSSNLVYVVDFAFSNVQLFDDEGKVLTFFGGLGGFPGAMDSPAGVCVTDTDLDLFARYVHPAFEAKRLIFVTNQIGPHKINVYALGDLKPGKTVADISAGRVHGLFGLGEPATDTAPSELGTLPATGPGTQPTTSPATQPGTRPAATLPGVPATAPGTQPLTRPKEETQQPF